MALPGWQGPIKGRKNACMRSIDMKYSDYLCFLWSFPGSFQGFFWLWSIMNSYRYSWSNMIHLFSVCTTRIQVQTGEHILSSSNKNRLLNFFLDILLQIITSSFFFLKMLHIKNMGIPYDPPGAALFYSKITQNLID